MTIDELVNEYNAKEKEQLERLKVIFATVKARSGFREVVFENGVHWSNCWSGESERLDLLTYFKNISREITRVEPGGE